MDILKLIAPLLLLFIPTLLSFAVGKDFPNLFGRLRHLIRPIGFGNLEVVKPSLLLLFFALLMSFALARSNGLHHTLLDVIARDYFAIVTSPVLREYSSVIIISWMMCFAILGCIHQLIKNQYKSYSVAEQRDDLERNPLVKILLSDLRENDESTPKDSASSDAQIIGLKGGWGTGKTHALRSVINQLEKDQNDKEIWLYSSSIGVTNSNDFLSNLLSEIAEKIRSRTGISTQDEVDRYLAIVSTIDNRLSWIKGILNPIKTPNDFINLINAITKSSRLAIYIFIDDIDRNTDENAATEFLKILREVIKLKNSKIILAYDPKNLHGLLGKSITRVAKDESVRIEGQLFLDKFIDKYRLIPNETSKKLLAVLFARLNEEYPELFKEINELEREHQDLGFNGNIRDIVKILDYFRPFMDYWDEIRDSIYLPDAFMLAYYKQMLRGEPSFETFLSTIHYFLRDSKRRMIVPGDHENIQKLKSYEKLFPRLHQAGGRYLTPDKRFQYVDNIPMYLSLIEYGVPKELD